MSFRVLSNDIVEISKPRWLHKSIYVLGVLLTNYHKNSYVKLFQFSIFEIGKKKLSSKLVFFRTQVLTRICFISKLSCLLSQKKIIACIGLL